MIFCLPNLPVRRSIFPSRSTIIVLPDTAEPLDSFVQRLDLPGVDKTGSHIPAKDQIDQLMPASGRTTPVEYLQDSGNQIALLKGTSLQIASPLHQLLGNFN
jgi:hypothetical protein